MTTLQKHVVASARGWLGTRFHHQGRLKKTDTHKGGVDCLGLLVGVAKELELKAANGTPITAYDHTEYTHTPNTYHLRQTLNEIMLEIPKGDMRAADVLLMDIDNMPQHLGIITEYSGNIGIIHAYAPARAVVEHLLDAYWQERIIAAFRLSSLNN
ncbi:MAG: C40 family peptidase [Alphaproteobacteria bacterium]